MARERPLLHLAGHGLDRPVVAADAGNLAPGEPFGHRLAGTRAALVVLCVVFHPQLHVASAEHDRVALAGFVDLLPAERVRDVVHGDDVADRQPFFTLRGRHVKQDAAREKRLAVLDAQLLQAVRAPDLGLREAVVVTDGVTNLGADVAQTVKLRADLTDLATEHLVVVHELLGAERSAGGAARDGDRHVARAEQGHPGLQYPAEAINLAFANQAGGL